MRRRAQVRGGSRPRVLDRPVFFVGLACLLTAVVGGGTTLWGMQFPELQPLSRVLLGAIGFLLLPTSASLYFRTSKDRFTEDTVALSGGRITISFLSPVDERWLEWIAWELEEVGYSVVPQPWDLTAIREPDDAFCSITIRSAAYVNAVTTSGDAERVALLGSTRALGARIEPVPDDLLGIGPSVDLFGKSEDSARGILLAGLRRHCGLIARGAPLESRERSVLVRPSYPGDLPKIWKVPHARKTSFTDRESLLRQLDSVFYDRQGAMHVRALTGLPGVGKTELAVEHAWAHYAKYRKAVWWVDAHDPMTLKQGLTTLADALEIQRNPDRQDDAIVEVVRQWLEHNKNWLLVLDGCDDPAQVLPTLPRGLGGHVLITSRRRDWSSEVRVLHVEPLDQDDATSFLLSRTGSNNKDAARRLAADLGGLPLAMEQAGAFIEDSNNTVSLPQYLNAYEQRAGKKPIGGHWEHLTVEATLALAVDQVKRESSGAADLLTLLAFLAPQGVARQMLAEGEAELPARLSFARDPLASAATLQVLWRYSLVSGNSVDGLVVHRMVQHVVRDRLVPDDYKYWAGVAVRLVNHQFPDPTNAQAWPACGGLMPHVRAVTGHALQATAEPSVTAELLARAASFLRRRGQLAAAREMLQQALDLNRATFGSDGPEVGATLNDLGVVLRDLTDLVTARAVLEKALAIRKNVGCDDTVEVADTLNNLGFVLWKTHDLSGAERCFERAREILQCHPDARPADIARALNGLGYVQQDRGDYSAAIERFREALAIFDALNEPQEVAGALSKLGFALNLKGERDQAMKHYSQALNVMGGSEGISEHPEVGWALTGRGLIHAELGNRDRAAEDHRQAMKIFEIVYGPDHDDVRLVRERLQAVQPNAPST